MHTSLLSRVYIHLGEVVGLHIRGYWIHLVRTCTKYMHTINSDRGALSIHIVEHRFPGISPPLDKTDIVRSGKVFVHCTREFYFRLNLFFAKFLSNYYLLELDDTVITLCLSIERKR